jgi:hypothetical protein
MVETTWRAPNRMLLENVASNPCIGCGPANPMGMRLVFEAEPEGASTRFIVEPRYQGFPGRLHSAVLYMALLETMNWSLYSKTGKMGLPQRTSALTMTRRVVVGDEVRLAGRVISVDAGASAGANASARLTASAHSPAGDAIGSLERDYRMVDEAEFLRAMGYDELPEGYEGAFG